MQATASGPIVPRAPLIAIALVLAATLVGTATVRLSGETIRAADAPTVSSRALRFADRPDGGIDILDGRSPRVLDTVHGEAGFLRGSLRALARGRMLSGLGPAEPFELIARADGRLTLNDPATGQRIDLESFGPQHSGTFRRLLTLPSQTTSQP